MTDAKREQLWAQLWKAIADVRDASPRVPSDADTDEIVAAVMPVVDELTAALDRVPHCPGRTEMSTEEIHDRVDALVDTDPMKLRDTLDAVVVKLDSLDGRSSDTDDILEEIRATLEANLA